MNQPNIVFFLADDLGWRDLSCEGSKFYESPNIDRIANEGMRFTQGYAACQVCSPSRASILTGKVTPRHGVTDYIGASSGEAWRRLGRQNKLLPPEYEHGLRKNETTFVKVLQDDGYRTFFAGKWHLGDKDSHPEQFGFDVNIGGFRLGRPPGGYFSPYDNPHLKDGPKGESLPIRLGTEAANWIEANKDEPFLVYLSFYSVHSPIQTSRDRWEKYRDKAVVQGPPNRRFIMDNCLPVRQVQDCPIMGGMVEAMDDGVGIVLKTLDRLGLSENTIVCFTSDNGGVSSGDAYPTSNLPLRGGKGRQWEGGIREPFYIKAPGITRPGSICDVPVSGIDYYSTLLELAACDIPDSQTIDGLSLVALLKGESDNKIETRDLYWHYPHYGNQGGDPSSILRRHNWKLIHYYEDGRDELYDLKNDEGEQNDVSGVYLNQVVALRSSLEKWLEDVSAKVPIFDTDYDAEKASARLYEIEHELMPELELTHAGYLDPNWHPNEDWWGSQVTID